MTMATTTLSRSTIRAIAEEVVKIMEEKKQPHLVTTSEAAKMLGITTRRLRELKHKFRYTKSGRNQQGRLLFDANTLQERYTRL